MMPPDGFTGLGGSSISLSATGRFLQNTLSVWIETIILHFSGLLSRTVYKSGSSC